MKKQLVKKMIQSTAALAVCAAILTCVPSAGSPAPGENGNDGRPGIITEKPDGENDGEAWKKPGITPMSDLPPMVNKED